MTQITRKPKSDRQAICQAYRAGRTMRQIAVAYGISHEAVRKVLVKSGVKIRPRGPVPYF